MAWHNYVCAQAQAKEGGVYENGRDVTFCLLCSA